MKRILFLVASFLLTWLIVLGAWWCYGEPFERGTPLVILWITGWSLSLPAGMMSMMFYEIQEQQA